MTDSSERCTLEQLLEAAQEQNLASSERLVVDWVSLGLLDRPERHGAGRGRGSAKGTWSEEQRQLFLTLLKKRSEVARIATLTNVPVGIWLLWGDRYVPLRQVRRALTTWAGGQHTSASAARRAAHQLVADFGTKQPRRKTVLIDFLADAMRGRDIKAIDMTQLRLLMQELGEGQRLDTGDVPFNITPEVGVQLFSTRLEALRNLQTFSDATFHWARFAYHVGRTDYATRAPQLAHHERFSHIFQDTSQASILNQACLDLVTTLGMSRLYKFAESPMDLDNPLAWEQSELRTQITRTAVHASGIDLEVAIIPTGPAQ